MRQSRFGSLRGALAREDLIPVKAWRQALVAVRLVGERGKAGRAYGPTVGVFLVERPVATTPAVAQRVVGQPAAAAPLDHVQDGDQRRPRRRIARSLPSTVG
mgnify:CR=1 FL=1